MITELSPELETANMQSKIDVCDSATKVAPHCDLGVLNLMAGIIARSFSGPPNSLFKAFLSLANATRSWREV